MGMDGLSMSNTAALREQTSADHANRTEQSVQADPSNDPKQVQNTSTSRAVREKEEEENAKKKKQEKDDDEEEFQDGIEEQHSEDEEAALALQDLDNPNKDFYVKLNSKDDIIELYDSSTDRLIETISGNEMQELVRKLNMASGIFINKKV